MARCKNISTSETNVSVVFTRVFEALLNAGEVLAGVAAAENPLVAFLVGPRYPQVGN